MDAQHYPAFMINRLASALTGTCAVVADDAGSTDLAALADQAMNHRSADKNIRRIFLWHQERFLPKIFRGPPCKKGASCGAPFRAGP
jgi:hypothetical protein